MWMNKQQTFQPASMLQNFQSFLNNDYAIGSLLLLATLGAILLPNGPWSDSYQVFLQHNLTLRLGPLEITENIQDWINSTLMAVFFLNVGLEIKQELVLGSLSSARKAALPVAGAIGGMIVPALVFTMFNWRQLTIIGWAIPMATHPAFAIAILSVLRNRIPAGLRAFLVTLAVVDDIGATLVIALVYHEGFSLLPILISAAIVLLLLLLNKASVRSLFPYLILGIFLWVAFMESGIHTSVAGVILALTIPVRSRHADQAGPVTRLERVLTPWVNYGILPVFALSNAGITFQGISLSAIFLTPVVVGIFLGLLVGKPMGIVAACLAVASLNLAHLPDGVRWRHLLGAGFLGGIGFTTSIFLANLAFTGDVLFDHSKIGILPASVSAAIIGWLVLRMIAGTEGENQLA
jgi:NhaA family Na+:H+ antiporter